MRATWRGQVIATSDQTLEVDGYRYFPRQAVRMELLRPAPKTQDDLACPHGVRLCDIVGEAEGSPRAAWSYERPARRCGMLIVGSASGGTSKSHRSSAVPGLTATIFLR